MILTLTRERNPQPDCTLGYLQVGSLKLATIERPWVPSPTCKGGKKGESCVPLGTYDLVLHKSLKHGKTWALVNHELDVVRFEGEDGDPDEDRATCLIHVANYARELQGCIAPGIAHQRQGNEYMVTSSRKAMEILRSVLPWEPHTLEIK